MKKLALLIAFALLPFACSFDGYNADFKYVIGPEHYVLNVKSLEPFYEYFINNSNDTIVVYTMGTISCEYDINNPGNVGATCVYYDERGKAICPDDKYTRDESNIEPIALIDKEDVRPPEDFTEYVLSNRAVIAPHDTLISENNSGGWYGSLKKGKYKMTLYYYMDSTLQEFIGMERFFKDRSKMPLGLYKSNTIEVLVN